MPFLYVPFAASSVHKFCGDFFVPGGMVLGGKGVSSVKNFDEQHNISLRVQIAAEMVRFICYWLRFLVSLSSGAL